MSATAIAYDRRQYSCEDHELWDRLSLSQKFSVRQLSQFGYKLQFIRHYDTGNMAVLMSDSGLATIDCHGEVDTAPDIQLRH